jgi:hypothetical protein
MNMMGGGGKVIQIIDIIACALGLSYYRNDQEHATLLVADCTQRGCLNHKFSLMAGYRCN